MSTTQATSEARQEKGLYEIRIRGHLDDRWTAWFDRHLPASGCGAAQVNFCQRKSTPDFAYGWRPCQWQRWLIELPDVY